MNHSNPAETILAFILVGLVLAGAVALLYMMSS